MPSVNENHRSVRRSIELDNGDYRGGALSPVGGSAALTANNTVYGQLSGSSTPAGAIGAVQNGWIAPYAMCISMLSVKLDAAPGSSKNVTVTVIVNGVASALTVTINGASATTGQDSTHAIVVAAGDNIKIGIAADASVASAQVAWGVVCSI